MSPQRHRVHREGFSFFDLSPELSGQIKILSPATRDRIRVDRMIDRNNRIGEVLGASIEVQKGVNVTLPEGLCPFARSKWGSGKNKINSLCLSGEHVF